MTDATWQTHSASDLEGLANRKQWRYARFAEDMEDAGYDPEPYEGRGFYKGPAVSIDDPHELQDVIRATQVRVQWDNLGLGLIIYPR